MAIYNTVINLNALQKTRSLRHDTMAHRSHVMALVVCLYMTIPITMAFLAPSGIDSGLEHRQSRFKNVIPTTQKPEKHQSRNEVSTNVVNRYIY